MSIVSVGQCGSGAVGGSSSATITVSTSATIEAGNVALLWWVSDNSSTADGDNNEHSTVTDSSGAVSWTKLGEYTNAEGAANAGVTTSLWYRPKQGSDLSSGSTITGTRVDGRTDQCALAWEFTCDYDLIVDGGPNGYGVDASNGFGSSSLSSLASVERLYFAALGKEANVASTNNLTPSTDFTATGNLRSRNNAAAVCTRAEFRINTSTGETSNPTFAFSGDTASVFVGLIEDAPVVTVPAPIIVPSSLPHVARRQQQMQALRMGTTVMLPRLTTGSGDFTLMADGASFALTGNAATLRRGYSMTAATGTFTLTGTTTTLRAARQMVASPASYTLTGNAAALRVARQITADPAVFTLTGNGATLTYTITGFTAPLVMATVTPVMRRQQVTRLARTNATVLLPRLTLGGTSFTLMADGAAYTLTGNDVTLTVATGYSMTADVASFVLTGQAAGLRVARQLAASPGTFTFTGQAAALRAARRLAADVAAFVLSGSDATLSYSGGTTHYTLSADAGVFTLTGNAAGLLAGRRLAADAGSFTLTGQAAALYLARQLAASRGTFTLTGNSAALTWSGAFSNLGEYTITLSVEPRYAITESGTTRYTIEET